MEKITQIVCIDVLVDETTVLSFTEFREKYSVEEAMFYEMLAQGLFEPVKLESEKMFLDYHSIQRIQSALRLHDDLGVNLPGAALALDLMEQLETLRAELAVMQQHLK